MSTRPYRESTDSYDIPPPPSDYLVAFDEGWKQSTTPGLETPKLKKALEAGGMYGNKVDVVVVGSPSVSESDDYGSFVLPNSGNETDADTEVDEEIPDFDDIFADLSLKFGFQDGVIQNVREFFTSQITSRASRLHVSNAKAIRSLHNDYISGRHSNYRKWALSEGDKTHQLSLYLCMMHEAGNIRLIPELICFLFKTADDYCESDLPESVRLVPKGSFLNDIIKPIYTFHRNQLYRSSPDPTKLIRREADHARTVGYDDINETFWDAEGMRRMVLKDGKGRLMDVSSGRRWEEMRNVDWER
ncbi:hypothetical protein HDU67_002091, partial [Dinochytrium kinnereticum]